MMAMLITIVGLLGLLQAVNVAIEHNLKNQLRDEAVLIAEQQMGVLKAAPFDQLPVSPKTVDSRLRAGFKNFYTVSWTTTPWSAPQQPAQAMLIQVTVNWAYKGIGYSHQVTSLRSQ